MDIYMQVSVLVLQNIVSQGKNQSSVKKKMMMIIQGGDVNILLGKYISWWKMANYLCQWRTPFTVLETP